MLGLRGREASKSAGVWVGHGCEGTGRYQSYLCCGKERAFEIMEGSGDEASMSPAVKESRRWGSKTGLRVGRGAFLSMALLMRDQSLANCESETASAKQCVISIAIAMLPHANVVDWMITFGASFSSEIDSLVVGSSSEAGS